MIGKEIGGYTCRIFSEGRPEFLLIRLSGTFEKDRLSDVFGHLSSESDRGFLLVSVEVGDWDVQLSPWKAPQPRGSVPFGGEGKKTLDGLTDKVIPAVVSEYGLEDVPVIIGGYSLAGLFSLWAGMASDRFDACVGASPSTWFRGWTDFLKKNDWYVRSVYLSLGDTEHLTKNSMLSKGRECIEETYRSASSSGAGCVLEWNPGGHFTDTESRTAKGFLWAMQNL